MKKITMAMIVTTLALALNTEVIAKNNQQEYEEYCRSIAECFDIQPELVEAICFKESSWNPSALSDVNCIGLMQINQKYHKKRMEKYGVTDLYDPYSNILVGCDYLAELFEKYGDCYEVLMVYNEGTKGAKRFEKGIYSDYAKEVCELAEKLEVEHGK